MVCCSSSVAKFDAEFLCNSGVGWFYWFALHCSQSALSIWWYCLASSWTEFVEHVRTTGKLSLGVTGPSWMLLLRNALLLQNMLSGVEKLLSSRYVVKCSPRWNTFPKFISVVVTLSTSRRVYCRSRALESIPNILWQHLCLTIDHGRQRLANRRCRTVA